MTAESESGLEAWAKRLRMRSDISDTDVAAVCALRGRLMEMQTGRDFVRVGEHADHVHLLVSGAAVQFGQTRQGARQIIAVHLPGEMTDLAITVLPTPCCAQTALRRTTLLCIPRQAIIALARTSHRLAMALWRDCSVDAAIVARWLVRNGQTTAPARLAGFLCEIGVRIEILGGRRDDYALALSQEQIGQALSLTSIHTNRTFRQLREQGLIEHERGQIRIPDWNELAAIGEFEPSYLHLDEKVETLAA